jgi:hypothetical protein
MCQVYVLSARSKIFLEIVAALYVFHSTKNGRIRFLLYWNTMASLYPFPYHSSQEGSNTFTASYRWVNRAMRGSARLRLVTVGLSVVISFALPSAPKRALEYNGRVV